MEREIKFRGLSLNGQWFYGNLSILTKDRNPAKKGSYISNSVGMPFAYAVRPETVGQYTGLKDNEGKEIWEGDIIEFAPIEWGAHVGNKFEVKWNTKEGEWDWGGGGRSGDMEWRKVIGTIYENPELLK